MIVFKHVYLEIDEGWKNLILQLDNMIVAYCQVEGCDYPVPVQVKQKFGYLRIYCNYPDSISLHQKTAINNMIHMFEKKSKVICEVCGKTAILKNRNHWISALCNEHENKST